MLNRTFAITKKELNQYFYSPMFFVALAGYFHLVGLIFVLYSYDTSSFQLDSSLKFRVITENVFNSMTFILPLLVLPFLSMHLISEEMKQGTDELLLTSPANLFEIVFGKYLSTLVVLFVIITVSLLFPLIISAFGPLDLGVLFSNYIGFLLVAATIMAVGLFTSALVENQIIAGISTFLILYVMWLLDYITAAFFFEQKELISQFSLMGRVEDLQKGLFDLTDVIYYLSLIVLFLILTIKVFERKRWK